MKGGSNPPQRSRCFERLAMTAPVKQKTNTSKRGESAEKIAAFWLSSRGLSLLAQNQRTRWGELDLVALDQETLVFVEVRMRKAHDTSAAIHSVDAKKQKKLRSAAQAFLAKHPQLALSPQRFDICAIAQTPDHSLHFQHLRAAFGE